MWYYICMIRIKYYIERLYRIIFRKNKKNRDFIY
jgi:hypothetical protein